MFGGGRERPDSLCNHNQCCYTLLQLHRHWQRGIASVPSLQEGTRVASSCRQEHTPNCVRQASALIPHSPPPSRPSSRPHSMQYVENMRRDPPVSAYERCSPAGPATTATYLPATVCAPDACAARGGQRHDCHGPSRPRSLLSVVARQIACRSRSFTAPCKQYLCGWHHRR